MPKLQVQYDRYDGKPLAEMIDASLLRFEGNNASIELPLGDDDEFSILFEAENASVSPNLLATARSVLRSIGELDNDVQDVCAAECRQSGLHPRNFEGMLAYVRIYEGLAFLHYFGTGVNTEWDEAVQLVDGKWVHGGVAVPLDAVRSRSGR